MHDTELKNLVEEMVNLIVAQRAYEMNSKDITTTDEMMQTANNLKRQRVKHMIFMLA